MGQFFLRRWVYLSEIGTLLRSMRFAVSLLIAIAVASVIGTVLAQNQPISFYLNEFGPFWGALFDKLGFTHVYSSRWFLLMVAFLLASTTLCLIRNTFPMLRDALSFHEYIKNTSLPAFTHRFTFVSTISVATITPQLRHILQHVGFAVRERHQGTARLLAAKKGGARRLGYVFTHMAIIIIGIGALLDSQLPMRLQMWFTDKHAINPNCLMSAVPSSGRLALNTLSFQASMRVLEGARACDAVVAMAQGALVQPLPFSLTLKKFRVDYYSTGAPRRFASTVQVQDLEKGKTFDQIIEVNQPLRYKGVTVYQSGFGEGKSLVQLRAYPLQGHAVNAFTLAGSVGQTLALDPRLLPVISAKTPLTLAITALQPVNVEDLEGAPTSSPMTQTMAALTGSAADKKIAQRRNLGPSVTFHLTDAMGQGQTFLNYMRPVVWEGCPVFLAGVQQNPRESYRYLRIPADENHTLETFMQLRAMLANAQMRQVAVQRFIEKTAPDSAQASLKTGSSATRIDLPIRANNGTLKNSHSIDFSADHVAFPIFTNHCTLEDSHNMDSSANRVDFPIRANHDISEDSHNLRKNLTLAATEALEVFSQGGWEAVKHWVHTHVPPPDAPRSADIMRRLVYATVHELREIARQHARMSPLPAQGEAAVQARMWTQLAVAALSDLFEYPAPIFLALTDYKPVLASVFQVSRTPGKAWVYLGSLLLILGVISMLYVRDRRVWIWITPGSQGRVTQVHVAMTSQRHTLDFFREFDQLRTQFTQRLAAFSGSYS